MSLLLSNPDLDELYSIRRILVGRFNASHKVNDEFGMAYYEKKINAMDKAIAAFIITESIEPEHTEQPIMSRVRSVLGLRIPGSEEPSKP